MHTENSDAKVVVLIAGYRFAGKSLVLQHLEQAGFACVDNLPPGMVFGYLSHRRAGDSGRVGRVAVALDIADSDEVESMQGIRERIAETGCTCRIVFIEAGETALAERASVSRVPESGDRGNGTESVACSMRDAERARLARVRAAADLVLDSSYASPAEERDNIIALAEGKRRQVRTVVEVSSFGYKFGAPAGDIVVDVRFIPNPYYVATLRPLTGKDKDCSDYVLSNENAKIALDALIRLARAMQSAYALQGRPALRIRIGCTGGRHRSVAMVEALGATLAKGNIDTHIVHRDLAQTGHRI